MRYNSLISLPVVSTSGNLDFSAKHGDRCSHAILQACAPGKNVPSKPQPLGIKPVSLDLPEPERGDHPPLPPQFYSVYPCTIR